MRLEQSFEVPVPVAQAWAVLLDLELVAPCMPGATLTSFDGTAFTGTVKVKLGPISLAYRGQGRITERDEPGRRIAFVAQGQDSRGAGGASARVSAVLHSAEGGESTVVKVVTDLDISGKAAQFGRGMIADVSGKVIKQFADNLAATIASGAAPAPAAVAPTPSTAPASVPAPASSPELAPTPTPEPLAVVAPIPTAEPAPAVESVRPPSPVVDAVPVAQPPALAPVFTEPAPPPAPVMPVFPPPPGESAAAESPAPVAAPAAAAEPVPAPEPAAAAEPEPYVAPTPAHSAPPEYHATPEPPAPRPEPTPVAAATPTPAPAPAAEASPGGSGLRRPPVEAEPLDLLAVSGAKGMIRKAAPVLVIVGLVVVGLIVWLVVG